MIFAAIIAAWVLISALGDWLSCEWHAARDAGRAWYAAALAGVLEVLTWAPVVLYVATESLWVLLACVAGSSAGSWLGVRRAARTK